MIRINAIWLVAQREITERLSGRATWILTVVTAVLAVALMVVPPLINRSTGPTRLGLVDAQAQALAPAIDAAANSAGISIQTSNVDSEDTARTELTPTTNKTRGGGGRLAQLLGQSNATLDVVLIYDGTTATIEAYQTVPPAISALLRSVINAVHQHEALAAAGLSATQIAAAERPVPTTAMTLQPGTSDISGRAIAALAGGLLLVYTVSGFGLMVANGVAQEKTSRTAEVLRGAVQPAELMTGKVVGIGLVGLAQVAITIGAAFIANSLVKSQSVPPELPTLLPMIIVWYVLGFTLYSFGLAAAGSMVARQEEVQSVALPINIFLVAGFLLVYATIASPDAPWLKLLSFFPPLAPVLMPARLALGTVAWWEVAIAIAIEVAAILGMARLAGGIYRGALVRGGARLSWGAALRLR